MGLACFHTSEQTAKKPRQSNMFLIREPNSTRSKVLFPAAPGCTSTPRKLEAERIKETDTHSLRFSLSGLCNYSPDVLADISKSCLSCAGDRVYLMWNTGPLCPSLRRTMWHI